MANQQLRFELIGSADDLISSFSEASSAAQRVDENLEGLEQAAKQAALGQLEYNEAAEQFVNESGDFISQAEAAGRAQARLNEIGIETTAQIRDQVQEFEALKTAYQDDDRAVADLNDRQQQLRNQLAEVGEAAAQQNQDLSRLDERFEQSTVTMTDFTSRQQLLQQELQESAQAQRQFASASGSADQAVLALSQGMEDIAFANNFGDAMRFAGNNVTQAAQSFGQARAEAGGLLATLRGVSPAVLGVGAFSALVALGPRLVSFFDDGEQAASSFKDTLSEVSGEVVTLNAAINDTEFEVPAEQLGKYRENLESSLTKQRALVAALEQSTRGLSTLGSEAADAGRSLVNTAFGADFELTQEQAPRGAEEAAERLGLEVETVRDAIRGSQSALLEVESTLSEQPAILEDAEERQQVLNQLLEDAETAIQRQQARQEALSAAREEAGAQLEENEDTLEDSAGTTDEIAQAQDRITRAVEQEIIAREEAKALVEDFGTSNDQIARSTAEALGGVEGLKQQFTDLLAPQGKALVQARRTKEQMQKQVEALRNVNRIIARREQGIQAEQVQPAPPDAPIGPAPPVLQSIQDLSGQSNVLKQYAQQLREARIQAQELAKTLEDIELAGSSEEGGAEGLAEDVDDAATSSSRIQTSLQSLARGKPLTALTSSVEELKSEFNLTKHQAEQLKDMVKRDLAGAAGQVGADLVQAFEDGKAEAQELVGVFQSGVANVLERFGGPLGAFAAPIVRSFQHGGEVQGPGGPTDDQVPAMLSDQEFVMRAASAQVAPEALQAMNQNPALAGMVEQFVAAQDVEQIAGAGMVGPGSMSSVTAEAVFAGQEPEEFASGGPALDTHTASHNPSVQIMEQKAAREMTVEIEEQGRLQSNMDRLRADINRNAEFKGR